MSRAKKQQRPPQSRQRPRTAPAAAIESAQAPAAPLTLRDAAIALGLAAMAIALFASLRSAEFIRLDDRGYISTNPHVTSGLTAQALSWAWTTGYAANWHPLTWMSHMLDVNLFGLWAGGHHLT